MTSVSQTLHRALALHRAGELTRAEGLYHEIVRHDPQHADALHLLGVAAQQQKRHRRAVEFIERAIEVRPSAVYYSNLGAAYRALEERDNAIRSLQSALQLDGGLADAHYNLGTLLKDAGEHDAAVICLRRALAMQPQFADAWNNLGILLYEQGQYLEAIACYRKAVDANPQLAPAHNNLGTAYCSVGRSDEAVRSYRRALEIDAAYAQARFNLGNACRELDRLDEAEDCYRRTLELDPRHVAALVNLGLVYQERGELGSANDCNDRAIEIDPEHVEAHVNRSFVRRLNGDLRAGFAEFEWRFREENIPLRFDGPVWDGSSLTGKSILVCAEQGVGDEIMFASCISDVVRKADRCIVECDRRLVPLFSRSFPTAKCIARCDGTESSVSNPPRDFGVRIFAGSLLQHLRPAGECFPQHNGYLIADGALQAKWQDRYHRLGSGLKIGISWRGGKRPQTRRKRSTGPELWRPVLSIGSVQFVNLQYGDCRAELAEFQQAAGVTVHHWDDADPLRDFDDFAAQISTLDLVISIDNSTVHMAGALAVPVWNLIPFSPDWRWQMRGAETLWYPSMRLFRQPSRGDWESVFAAVAVRLNELANTASRAA